MSSVFFSGGGERGSRLPVLPNEKSVRFRIGMNGTLDTRTSFRYNSCEVRELSGHDDKTGGLRRYGAAAFRPGNRISKNGVIGMNIVKTQDGSVLTVALEGRLDSVTAPELDADIKASLDGVTELVLDFEKLDYISSAGLRVLLSAHKTMSQQGSMKVVRPNESVKEIFDITGFSEILTVE